MFREFTDYLLHDLKKPKEEVDRIADSVKKLIAYTAMCLL